MFWTVIRWGGSALIIVLVLAAAFLSSQSAKDPAADGAVPVPVPVEQGEATPIEAAPADNPPPQNKNFNL
jgi:hypothetical protein